MSALVLLNTSANSWYSGGIPSNSLGATGVRVVLSEDILSWKVSESFSLQTRAKAAAFTRAIYGAFNFGGVRSSTGGVGVRVGGAAVAARAVEDVKFGLVYSCKELCSAGNVCVFRYKEVGWCVGIAVILRGVGRVEGNEADGGRG
jgi:hypothetical protein